jgi:hypothetical protein
MAQPHSIAGIVELRRVLDNDSHLSLVEFYAAVSRASERHRDLEYDRNPEIFLLGYLNSAELINDPSLWSRFHEANR